MNTERWIQITAFYRNKLEEMNEQIRVNTRAKREIEKDLARVELSIHDHGNEEFKTVNQVLVTVAMKEEGEVNISVTYIVYGPGWYPVYDVRVSSEEKKMNISYNGIIQQATGEDWNDAVIKLSTAQVQVSGKQPELVPWHLCFQRPPMQPPMSASFGSARSAKAEQMFESTVELSEEDMEMDELPAMEVPETVVETGSTAVVFAVGGSNTIKGDNKDHKVTIMIKEFPAQLRYSSVPKLSPYAFLKAKVTNGTDYPFLAGETNVFLDNNFVSKSYMDMVAPTEEFWTFLGVDESMKVEYKLLKKYHKEEGMIGKRNILIYEYLTKITNNKKTEEEMVLWDQIPISNDEDISVKLINPKYKENTDSLKKNESDYFEWFFLLQPGDKVEVPFTFSVEYPKGKVVSGL